MVGRSRRRETSSADERIFSVPGAQASISGWQQSTPNPQKETRAVDSGRPSAPTSPRELCSAPSSFHRLSYGQIVDAESFVVALRTEAWSGPRFSRNANLSYCLSPRNIGVFAVLFERVVFLDRSSANPRPDRPISTDIHQFDKYPVKFANNPNGLKIPFSYAPRSPAVRRALVIKLSLEIQVFSSLSRPGSLRYAAIVTIAE